MKLALLGHGKMGQLIEKIALSKGYPVVSTLTSQKQEWSQASQADIWVDFSHASATLSHVQKAAENHKNILIGTTGWETDLNKVQAIARSKKIGILYAPNCSLGVLLFMKILESTSKTMSSFNQYDVGGVEYHHQQKKDAPSGTAKAICTLLEKNLERKIDFSSVRLGSIPGKHEVIFDSPFDSITLTHEAKDRTAFASGALQAAQWLIGKTGFFTLDDYIEGILNGT